MVLPAIEELLRQTIGLDASVFTDGTLATIVRSRMAEHGITDSTLYLHYLHQSAQELDTLVEAIIVPETWFFRDREPFALVQHYVKDEWMKDKAIKGYPRRLRALSVPCSTGEEPYSIAIALMKADLSPVQFQIDAVDISQRALQRAQLGIYDQHSFRGTHPDFQQRYFTPTTSGYCLRDDIKQSVHFQRSNVLDPTFAHDRSPYDLIFCRNLLIYFDAIARARTLKLLHHLLSPQGLLFVGHAETALLSTTQFTPVRYPFAFAYRKANPIPPSRPDSHQNSPQSHSPKGSSCHPTPHQRAGNSSTGGQSVGNRTLGYQAGEKRAIDRHFSSPPSATDTLHQAKHLANQGQLEAAIHECQTYLAQHRTSADAYVLLGQLHQAMGQEQQAEQDFQKALYLNPKHLEALVHLTLLLEQQGDLTKAAPLRQRIQRLANTSTS